MKYTAAFFVKQNKCMLIRQRHLGKFKLLCQCKLSISAGLLMVVLLDQYKFENDFLKNLFYLKTHDYTISSD